jgi:L-threonylcarbamoyladenylate synthase
MEKETDMQTEILRVDAGQPEAEVLARAAEVLQRGGLVAFPTETVYGLGANALDAAAVGRIFAAKERPATNPVIVHVADAAAVRSLVVAWPELAERLAARFWPGPLTLILPKQATVPDIVTAGGATVAVRVPAHPVALALLRQCRLPIAAPSANRATQLSPTTAAHVVRGLSGRVELVLDGGPTPGGVESTVLDLSVSPPRLLRPGLVSPATIEEVIGPIARPPTDAPSQGPLPSPGMMPRHYAPRTPLECVSGSGAARVAELCGAGLRVGWLAFEDEVRSELPELRVMVLPREPATYAAGLYAALHAFDDMGLDRIVVTLPPATEEWLMIHDRLRRASAAQEP